MKKLALLAIAAFVTTIACAQIQFGAKAGLNLANVGVSPKPDDVSYSMRPSLYAGGLVFIPLFSNFALQPELMYSSQGAKLKYQSISSTTSLGYINIPVLFKYKDPSGFFAEAGPQVGFLLSAKEKSGGTTVDAKDDITSTDVSAVLGVGYLSALNVGVNLRYNLGLTNLAKDAIDGTAKNRVIQIGIFYMFGEGGKK